MVIEGCIAPIGTAAYNLQEVSTTVAVNYRLEEEVARAARTRLLWG